jgi:hypothetical protein
MSINSSEPNFCVPCECEHFAHFPDAGQNTPNGNPGHRYGATFAPRTMVKVRHAHVIERVCSDCANDCRAHDKRV